MPYVIAAGVVPAVGEYLSASVLIIKFISLNFVVFPCWFVDSTDSFHLLEHHTKRQISVNTYVFAE